jgi:hypothetical protein
MMNYCPNVLCLFGFCFVLFCFVFRGSNRAGMWLSAECLLRMHKALGSSQHCKNKWPGLGGVMVILPIGQ